VIEFIQILFEYIQTSQRRILTHKNEDCQTRHQGIT